MSKRRDRCTQYTPLELSGKGFDCTVYVTPFEKDFCEQSVLEGNMRAQWNKYIHPNSETYKDRPAKDCIDGYKNTIKNTHIRTYMEWFKSRIGNELVINTDVILKRIAAALSADANDIIDEDGKIRNLADISPLARANLKIKWKVNAAGEVLSADIEMMTYKEVLDSLLKMSTVDNDLVKTLVQKIAAPEVKITKQ